jgi:signal transduction histidine kinase
VVASFDDSRQRIDLDADGDTRVQGHDVWLGRAVRNLVDNALVHSEPGSRVSLGVRRDGDDVVIRVQSSGAVPTHVRERAFRRFVTTRADKGGTGLGLAIARAVVEAHGGRAEMARPGPPTVEFLLRLPAFRRAVASQGVESA